MFYFINSYRKDESTIFENLFVYFKEFEIFEVDINYIQTEKTGMSYF